MSASCLRIVVPRNHHIGNFTISLSSSTAIPYSEMPFIAQVWLRERVFDKGNNRMQKMRLLNMDRSCSIGLNNSCSESLNRNRKTKNTVVQHI